MSRLFVYYPTTPPPPPTYNPFFLSLDKVRVRVIELSVIYYPLLDIFQSNKTLCGEHFEKFISRMSTFDSKMLPSERITGSSTSPAVISESFCGIPQSLPSGILSFDHVAEILGYTSSVSIACDVKNLPGRKAAALPKYDILEGFIESADNKEDSIAAAAVSSISTPSSSPIIKKCTASDPPLVTEWTMELPYSASILGAKWLTPSSGTLENIELRRKQRESCSLLSSLSSSCASSSSSSSSSSCASSLSRWGTERRVAHIDIGLGDSGIVYVPGDSIGIMAPNPSYLVEAVCNRTTEAFARMSMRGATTTTASVSAIAGASADSIRSGFESRSGVEADPTINTTDIEKEKEKERERKVESGTCTSTSSAVESLSVFTSMCISARVPIEKSLLDCDIHMKNVTTSIRELLTYILDFTSVPRKYNIYTLASYCTNIYEKQKMLWLCSKCAIGKALWNAFIEEQGLGLGELILLFPSCTPPLGALINIANKSVPRYYSAASSPMERNGKAQISIAFSLVHYNMQIHAGTSTGAESQLQPIQRSGLCTSYMEYSARKWLYSTTPELLYGGIQSNSPDTYASRARYRTPKLRIFHKSQPTFRLPGSVAPPLLLIGPGTGVAPFIGFLESRHAIEQMRLKKCDDACEGVWRGGFEIDGEDLPGEANIIDSFINEVLPGHVHMFFGCRNDDDYLYREELQKHLQNGTLTTLDIAMSRTQEHKVYVTHKIIERGAEITQLMLNDGVYIYVCGDGNGMAKDVNNAFVEILITHGDMDEAQALDFIATLKIKRRYSLDIWS